MRISLGYPDLESEKRILLKESKVDPLKNVKEIISHEELKEIISNVENVEAGDKVINYLLAIVTKLREMSYDFSTRASISFLKASKAYAFIEGRDFVIPEDIKACCFSILNHRLLPDQSPNSYASENLINQILEQVKIP